MSLTFNEPAFSGLFLVISGGQCGVDRAGIEVAYSWGLSTGGCAPRGYRTHFGPKPELGSKFGLIEDSSPLYPPRTRRNVKDANGTLIIASNPDSPGCLLTSRLAKELQKPLKIVQLTEDYTNNWLQDQALEVTNWIIKNHIYVLNVAGNRDKFGTFHYYATDKLLNWVFMNLHNADLLVIKDLE